MLISQGRAGKNEADSHENSRHSLAQHPPTSQVISGSHRLVKHCEHDHILEERPHRRVISRTAFAILEMFSVVLVDPVLRLIRFEGGGQDG